MINAYRRKKSPLTVRRALLDHAAALALKEGLAAVTIQAVSSAAGVTKGGLVHHFVNKEALINALFDDVIGAFEKELDAYMQSDPVSYGIFTRAYLKATMQTVDARATVAILMLSDAHLRERWRLWYETTLLRHRATDEDPTLSIVRLAADGVWIALSSKIELAERENLFQALLAQTYPHN